MSKGLLIIAFYCSCISMEQHKQSHSLLPSPLAFSNNTTMLRHVQKHFYSLWKVCKQNRIKTLLKITEIYCFNVWSSSSLCVFVNKLIFNLITVMSFIKAEWSGDRKSWNVLNVSQCEWYGPWRKAERAPLEEHLST